MTKRERQILQQMVDSDDYLIQDGLEVWVGLTRTSAGLLISLLRQCFVSPDSSSPEIYFITGSGRLALEGKPPYTCYLGHGHESFYDVCQPKGEE